MLDPARRPFMAGLVFGAAHALLFGLAFPPVDLRPLILLAAAPLMVLGAAATTRPRRAALGVYVAALPVWGFQHQWVWAVSAAGFFPLAMYLALWPALFVWLLARVRARAPRVPLWVAAPVLWVGLEVLRGEVVWHGYPWFLLGHPTIGLPLFPEIAPWLGVYGVSLAVACVNAVVAGAVVWLAARLVKEEAQGEGREPTPQPPPSGRGLVAPALLGAALLLLDPAVKLLTLGRADARPVREVRIAAVQTNLPQDNKTAWPFEDRVRDFRAWTELTIEAAGAEPEPDVIFWPETMFPGIALNEEALGAEREAGLYFRLGDGSRIASTAFADELTALQAELGIPMVVGAIAAEGLRIETDENGALRIDTDAEYNSAFVIAGGAVMRERYDKIHLTPFGEVMPYISSWGWLERQLLALGARGMSFDLEAGAGPVRLDVPISRGAGDPAPGAARPPGVLRVATPICFEVTMSRVCRRLVFEGGERRADLLANLTNDGWFGWFGGGRQNHLLNARWRCLELATPMVRAANTGISAAIDHRGKIIAQGPDGREGGPASGAGVPGLMAAVVPLGPERPTLFARTGNAAGWAALAAAGLIAGAALWPRRGGAGRRREGMAGDGAVK